MDLDLDFDDSVFSVALEDCFSESLLSLELCKDGPSSFVVDLLRLARGSNSSRILSIFTDEEDDCEELLALLSIVFAGSGDDDIVAAVVCLDSDCLRIWLISQAKIIKIIKINHNKETRSTYNDKAVCSEEDPEVAIGVAISGINAVVKGI